jgi:hypothetical protein
LTQFPSLSHEEIAKVIALDWSKLGMDQRIQYITQYENGNVKSEVENSGLSSSVSLRTPVQ